jgi:hypothetical protein
MGNAKIMLITCEIMLFIKENIEYHRIFFLYSKRKHVREDITISQGQEMMRANCKSQRTQREGSRQKKKARSKSKRARRKQKR